MPEKALREYRFLLWIVLPLAGMLLSGSWLTGYEVPGQLDALKRLVVDNLELDGADLSNLAQVHLATAVHIAAGVNFLLIICCLVVIAFSTYTLAHNLNSRQLAAAFPLAAVVALTGIWMHIANEGSAVHDWYFAPWSELVGAMLKTQEWVEVVLVFMTNTAVALTAVAAATYLSPTVYEGLAGANRHTLRRQITRKLGQLRVLVYAAAVQMTVGVFGIYFGLRINIAAVEESARGALSQLVAGMSLYYGIAYTIFLLAAFVPCIVSLTGTARRLTQPSSSEPSNYELLARTGLRVSLMGDLRQFGVLLGPLVAAISASLIEFVGA